jgi:phospholipase D-like protein
VVNKQRERQGGRAGIFGKPRSRHEEDITPTIVKLIDGSQRSLKIAAFTSPDIANATIRARACGVDVQLITDTEQAHANGSIIGDLLKAGPTTRHKRSKQHSKYILIDRSNGRHRQLQLHPRRRRAQQRKRPGHPRCAGGGERVFDGLLLDARRFDQLQRSVNRARLSEVCIAHTTEVDDAHPTLAAASSRRAPMIWIAFVRIPHAGNQRLMSEPLCV